MWLTVLSGCAHVWGHREGHGAGRGFEASGVARGARRPARPCARQHVCTLPCSQYLKACRYLCTIAHPGYDRKPGERRAPALVEPAGSAAASPSDVSKGPEGDVGRPARHPAVASTTKSSRPFRKIASTSPTTGTPCPACGAHLSCARQPSGMVVRMRSGEEHRDGQRTFTPVETMTWPQQGCPSCGQHSEWWTWWRSPDDGA